jgi:hypothetical protein
MSTLFNLPLIHVRGTPSELGRGQGEQLKSVIAEFVAQRIRAAKVYLFERGIRDQAAFINLGRQCLALLKTWDYDGWVEHMALAEAASVDAVELYTTGNMTDIRDILVLGAMSADAEGCTTALIPGSHTKTGGVLAAQTWDLNPTDLDFVVAVYRQPTNGPDTWSITCAGCPSLMGMNSSGIAVGTTNIKTYGSKIGIPYLSLLHRAIRCSTRAEALQTIITAPRAGAHTYWSADSTGVDDVECTASSHVLRQGHQPLVRTNHCQSETHIASEGEPATPSSQARLQRARSWVTAKQDVESLKALFADRSNGVHSINRRPEDAQGTATNACMIAIPGNKVLHVCRGPSDRGQWIELTFT